MRTAKLLSSLSLFILLAIRAGATTFYVNAANPAPALPFTTWSTAATNIQNAIDASTNGDLIVVTNGVYQNGGTVMAGDLTNRVALNKPVTVQSVNGPWVTTILGTGATNGTTAVRCAWLTNGASLVGFTLMAGATRSSGTFTTLETGGGIWCASSNALVSNCVIVSNTAYFSGGGIYSGTVNNSLISSNGSSGAAYQSVLNNCTIVNNAGYGVSSPVAMTNCIIYFDNNNKGNYAGTGITGSHCCTTPALTGTGNFTNAPQLFVDGVHLSGGSPCIGAGISPVPGTDIFGNAWSNPPSVGCAEWQPSPIVTTPQVKFSGNQNGFTIGNSAFAGQSPFSFAWLKDGVPLQDNGNFSSTQTTNLIVTGVILADAGNYQLVVTNAFGAATSQVAQVVIHAVAAAGANPVAPYSTWTTAATNIQDAINAASAGDIVLVTNGVYASGGKVMAGDLTNRVALNLPIVVLSVNGYSATVIQGAWDPVSTNGPGAVRCAYLADGAVLNGFTLQNGATRATGDGYAGGPLESGGGIFCNSTNGIVSNCLLTNNSAVYGGGIGFGTLDNSLVLYNLAISGGGAL